jgi:hypothetical protein
MPKDNPRGFPDAPQRGVGFLDLSTYTGWAYGVPRQTPYCGTWDLSKDWDSGDTVDQFYDVLCDFLEWFKPSWLCMEKAIAPNAIVSNVDAWNTQIGLAAVTRLAGAHYGLRVFEYPSQTMRAEVLRGLPWHSSNRKKGEAKPVDVIQAWANENGVFPPDHNAGDALVGLEHALRIHCRAGFVRDFAQGRG